MKRRSVKLIKRSERAAQRQLSRDVTAPNKWSTSVRSWIVEFQQRDRGQTLPAFDSLFRDELLPPEPAD